MQVSILQSQPEVTYNKLPSTRTINSVISVLEKGSIQNLFLLIQ